MDMWERWWEMYEQENECYASFAKDAESEAPLWLEMVPGGLGAVIAGDRQSLNFAVMRVIANCDGLLSKHQRSTLDLFTPRTNNLNRRCLSHIQIWLPDPPRQKHLQGSPFLQSLNLT